MGTPAASTVFTTTSGEAPIQHDVGVLGAAQTFEFIVNATPGVNPSAALMGDFSPNGWGIKYEQWNKTGVIGLTEFGVADHSSSIPSPVGDTHLVFATDGATGTDVYVNGALQESMSAIISFSGVTTLGGVLRESDGSFVDPLSGSLLGFASYDGVLPADEIAMHSDAFFVPEPSSAALLGLGALAFFLRRRK